VLPVHNRRALLRGALDALTEQTYDNFEVIVVDDGSDDGSGEEALADARSGRPVRLLRVERGGAVAARTAGVAASRAELLAFTDSDCVPSPGWLKAGVAALDAGADVVNGRTVPAGPVGPLDHSMGSGEEGLYPTCNIFFTRAAYDRAGGFDRAAPARMGFRPGTRPQRLGFGEDTLLGWRVRRTGTAIYEPEALVEHAVFRAGVSDVLSRSWMAAAFPALVREVPELRTTALLRGRVSLGHRTRGPVYAVAAGLAVRSREMVLAAFGWWAWSAWRESTRMASAPSGRAAALPLIMATDTVTAAALVSGSVRARTLVV
jgi:glycosyltransferase involved in cell wall biosynthesis